MKRQRRTIVFATALVLAGLGCAQLEGDAGPTVIVTGPTIVATGAHSVVVGSSVAISVTTSDGEDASYTFTSADPTIATVDGAGVVTGIATGETSVTITGDDTMATAGYPIVVLSPTDASRIPYYEKWSMSAHADGTALAFNNWNADGQVPTTCARCHSSEGFVDYIGGDGTAAGVVDHTAPTKSVIRCVTCHNPAADALSSVTFPSGVTVDELGGEARCMTCHQGRSSGPQVDAAIAAAAPATDDTVSAMLNFQNIHYFPAAATLYAGRAKGGYQYAGQVYDVRFRHVDSHDTCIGCHDPHSTRVKFDECATCHTGVSDVAGAHQIRMISSAGIDYDGDGNTTEGIYDELVGLRDKLAAAIQKLRLGARLARLLLGRRLPLLVRRRRRRRHLLGGGGGRRQRVQELDRAPAARDLQLPDGAQGSGRLRAQRQVHHRAAVRLDHRRQHRAGRQGRHDQGGAHRRRPLQRRQRRRPATGTRANRSTRAARPATAVRRASASTFSTAPARWCRRPPTGSTAPPATTSRGPTSRRSCRSRR